MEFGKKANILFLIGIATLLIVSGCGSDSNTAPAPNTTTISGSVFAAPVSHASVVVLNSTGTTTIAGPVTTAGDGTYSITIPSDALASDLIISSTSGTFTDEATQTTTSAGTLRAFISAGTLTTGAVHLDPSTTIIAALVKNHGKTAVEAKNLLSQAFGYAPDCAVAPRNMSGNGSNDAQRLSAFRAMAFSQLTKNLGLTPDKQFDLLTALALDLSDGTLDGKQASTSIPTLTDDIQNRFAASLVTLLTNTTANLTGLNEGQIGTVPFAKVAITTNYHVTYQPGMMTASQGKTKFTIKIDNLNGTPAPGKTVTLMPKMHMAGGMGHATPVGTVVDNGDGTYDCTAYYLMASGPGMGYWELKIMIGMESATFYPAVGMAMGDTTRATLTATSSNDTITSGMSTAKRSYYLFNDGLVGTTGFNLFIATKESMMSYPAVSVGTVLSNPTGTVNSMTVRASTDSNPDPNVKAWINATPGVSPGQWSISGLTNQVSGQTATIYVQLTVNAEQKTTDGLVSNVTGTNTYAAFTITPQ